MATIRINDLPFDANPHPDDAVPIDGLTTRRTTVESLMNNSSSALLASLASESGASMIGFEQAGSGAQLRTVEDKLRDFVNVKDFGATGNGSTDDTASIQAALSRLTALGGGILYFPTGTYVVNETLSTGTFPIHFWGDSTSSTIITAAHSDGPVIRIMHHNSSVQRLTIDATISRQNGAMGANFGILDMPADSAGQQVNGTIIEQVYVRNQPSHGIAFVTSYKDATVTNSIISFCKGHGIWTDDGETGDLMTSNIARVGGIVIKQCRIISCTGHAVCAGGPDSLAYRIHLDNIDTFRCAVTSGVRLSAHTIYMRCENAVIENCGIAGFSGEIGEPRVAAIMGISIQAAGCIIRNNRFVDCLQSSIQLGSNADGTIVEGLFVSNTVTGPHNPAVVIDSGCNGIRVFNGYMNNIDRLTSAVASGSGNSVTISGLSPTAFRSSRSELLINDNSVASFTFTGITRGILVLSGNSASNKDAIFGFRVGDGSAYVSVLTNGTDIAGAVGVPDGTTGSDGSLTVFASSSTNELFIENRLGLNGAYTPTFLSLGNGEMVL